MLTSVLLYIAPCWIINISLNGLYVLKNRYPDLVQFDLPVDNWQTWRGKRILGNSTTWAGLLVAVVVAIFISFGFQFSKDIALLYAICVYGGHAVGSFIKRRFNFNAGDYMPIVDHGDYAIVTGLVFFLTHNVNWEIALLALGISLLIHPLITYISYKLGLKKYPL